jgi:hypothetical protein
MWRRSVIRQVVLWLVVILGCIANAQEQSQNPAPPDTSATPAGDGTRPPDSPGTAGNSIRLGLSHAIEASQARDVGKGFGIIPPDFGAGHVYWDFSGSTTSGPVNPNAPWKVSARFTHAFDNGTIANVGVIGYRNYRIPPFLSQAIGSGQDLTLPLASFVDFSQQKTQWMFTAGIEKTFITIPGGTTIGGVGDVFLPLNKVAPSLIVPDTKAPASLPVRGGLKLGF